MKYMEDKMLAIQFLWPSHFPIIVYKIWWLFPSLECLFLTRLDNLINILERRNKIILRTLVLKCYPFARCVDNRMTSVLRWSIPLILLSFAFTSRCDGIISHIWLSYGSQRSLLFFGFSSCYGKILLRKKIFLTCFTLCVPFCCLTEIQLYPKNECQNFYMTCLVEGGTSP